MRDCTTPGVIPVGDVCTLTCKDGYQLVGSNYVTCGAPNLNKSEVDVSQHVNGRYSGVFGECRRKKIH